MKKTLREDRTAAERKRKGRAYEIVKTGDCGR